MYLHTSIVVDQEVLSCGGWLGVWRRDMTNRCWRLRDGNWTEAPPLPDIPTSPGPLMGEFAALNSSVFWVAEYFPFCCEGNEKFSNIYELSAGGDEWQEVGQLQEGRQGHCVTVTDTTIVITGGIRQISIESGGIRRISSAETYKPGENSTRMTGEMREARYDHGCIGYQAGEDWYVLVAGGRGGMGSWYLESVERLKMTGAGQGMWETLGNLPEKQRRFTFPMVSVQGKIYLLGGKTPDESHPTHVEHGARAVSSVLVTTDGTEWEETTPMDIPRYGHTAVSTETLPCNGDP